MGFTALVAFLAVASANAALVVVGTATYGGSDYKLIYDVEDQLTWLDYSHSGATHPESVAWAAGLDDPGVLTIKLDAGYSTSWGATVWRLAGDTTGNFGYFSVDRYINSSEMEGLYYDELGNTLNDSSLNFGDFAHLNASYYHMSADPTLTGQLGLSYSARFNFSNGVQEFGSSSVNGGIYAMAVHPGAVIPEPVTPFLLLLGALALAWRRTSPAVTS